MILRGDSEVLEDIKTEDAQMNEFLLNVPAFRYRFRVVSKLAKHTNLMLRGWLRIPKRIVWNKKNKNNLKRDPFYTTLTAAVWPSVWGSGKMAGNNCLDVKCELCICAYPILKLFTQEEDFGPSHSCKKRRRWDTEQAAWQVCGVRSKALLHIV